MSGGNDDQIILSTVETSLDSIVMDFCEQLAARLYGKKFADTRQVRPIPVVADNFTNVNKDKKHFILLPDDFTMEEYRTVDCIIYLDRMLKFTRLYLGITISYLLYKYETEDAGEGEGEATSNEGTNDADASEADAAEDTQANQSDANKVLEDTEKNNVNVDSNDEVDPESDEEQTDADLDTLLMSKLE